MRPVHDRERADVDHDRVSRRRSTASSGFRILVDGAGAQRPVVAGRRNGSRAPDPFSVQRHPPFLGPPVPVVTKSEFRNSGFTEAHLARHALLRLRARRRAWSSTCGCSSPTGERFVYAYYAGVDSVAHAHGLHDGFYPAELAAADRLVGDVLDVLPPDARAARHDRSRPGARRARVAGSRSQPLDELDRGLLG